MRADAEIAALLETLIEAGHSPPLWVMAPRCHVEGIDPCCLRAGGVEDGAVLAECCPEDREQDPYGVWRHWLVYDASGTLIHRCNPSPIDGE